MTPKISFRCSHDLYEEIEQEIEDSVVFENMSHFCRVAVRESLRGDNEFEQAR